MLLPPGLDGSPSPVAPHRHPLCCLTHCSKHSETHYESNVFCSRTQNNDLAVQRTNREVTTPLTTQIVTFTTNATRRVASDTRMSSHEEHVIRTCFIDLWFRHVILGLVQEIHQLPVKFALFRLDVLHEHNRIFTRLCLVLFLFVLIYPFLLKWRETVLLKSSLKAQRVQLNIP